MRRRSSSTSRLATSLRLSTAPTASAGCLMVSFRPRSTARRNAAIAAGFSVAEAGSIRSNLAELGYPVLSGLLWVVIGFLILVLPLSYSQRRLERRWAVSR